MCSKIINSLLTILFSPLRFLSWVGISFVSAPTSVIGYIPRKNSSFRAWGTDGREHMGVLVFERVYIIRSILGAETLRLI